MPFVRAQQTCYFQGRREEGECFYFPVDKMHRKPVMKNGKPVIDKKNGGTFHLALVKGQPREEVQHVKFERVLPRWMELAKADNPRHKVPKQFAFNHLGEPTGITMADLIAQGEAADKAYHESLRAARSTMPEDEAEAEELRRERANAALIQAQIDAAQTTPLPAPAAPTQAAAPQPQPETTQPAAE